MKALLMENKRRRRWVSSIILMSVGIILLVWANWEYMFPSNITVNEAYSQTDFEEYLQKNPRVANAINTLDQETKALFWKYVKELAETGAINMADPVGLSSELLDGCDLKENYFETRCQSIELTDSERKMIIAANAAHSIWVDYKKILPWSLGDYTESEFSTLTITWESCCFDQNGKFIPRP